jgi:hypothetical protein
MEKKKKLRDKVVSKQKHEGHKNKICHVTITLQ